MVVSGNIGAGKSSLLGSVEREFIKRGIRALVVSEPLDELRCFGPMQTNILEAFYAGEMDAMSFQVAVFTVLTETYVLSRERAERGRYQVLLFERSVYDALFIFAKVLEKCGRLSSDQYAVLTRMMEALDMLVHFNVDVSVLLRAPVHVCLKRIQERGRPEEVEAINHHYLADLTGAHDNAWRMWRLGGKRRIEMQAQAPLEVLAPEFVDRVMGLETVVEDGPESANGGTESDHNDGKPGANDSVPFGETGSQATI